MEQATPRAREMKQLRECGIAAERVVSLVAKSRASGEAANLSLRWILEKKNVKVPSVDSVARVECPPPGFDCRGRQKPYLHGKSMPGKSKIDSGIQCPSDSFAEGS